MYFSILKRIKNMHITEGRHLLAAIPLDGIIDTFAHKKSIKVTIHYISELLTELNRQFLIAYTVCLKKRTNFDTV